MNIFALHDDPQRAAEMHCDKHVVKMVLESAQILSTVHHMYDTSHTTKIYRPTHKAHPCTLWAAENTANYAWLRDLYWQLGIEYTYRYGKMHKSMEIFNYLADIPYQMTIEHQHTPFARAMPDQYKFFDDPIDSYRAYYINEKAHILQYTRRDEPEWLN